MSDRTEKTRCAVTILPGGGCARPYGHEDREGGLEFSAHLTADECDAWNVPKAEDDGSTCDE